MTKLNIPRSTLIGAPLWEQSGKGNVIGHLLVFEGMDPEELMNRCIIDVTMDFGAASATAYRLMESDLLELTLSHGSNMINNVPWLDVSREASEQVLIQTFKYLGYELEFTDEDC